MIDTEAAVAAAFRQEWGQVVATLIGMTGDWDLAEEQVYRRYRRFHERNQDQRWCLRPTEPW